MKNSFGDKYYNCSAQTRFLTSGLWFRSAHSQGWYERNNRGWTILVSFPGRPRISSRCTSYLLASRWDAPGLMYLEGKRICISVRQSERLSATKSQKGRKLGLSCGSHTRLSPGTIEFIHSNQELVRLNKTRALSTVVRGKVLCPGRRG